MAGGLNKKQRERLNALSHGELLTVIDDLIQDNKQAKTTLINKYLLSDDDLLKAVQKEYAKLSKSTRFYDYYTADARFHELTRIIAEPLKKTAATLPEQTEGLCAKIIHGFERLIENIDSSSGSWMTCYSSLIEAWISAVAAQKNSPPAVIADKMVNFFDGEFYFGAGMLKQYRTQLGNDVLRAMRDRYYQKQEFQEAVDLSLLIADVNFLERAVNNDEFCSSQHYFGYARLLIDEVQPEKALALLELMEARSDVTPVDDIIWLELFITALIEDGRRREAMDKARDAFSHTCDTRFYRLYMKAGGDPDNDTADFIRTAKAKGLRAYLHFAEDLTRFDLISDVLIATPVAELESHFAYCTSSSLRTLSGKLYQHGFALAAVILRRVLVESYIDKAQSKYYAYAASDMKKAIDYSEGLEESAQFAGTLNYLRALYAQHKRKSALWQAMAGKVQGLSADNNRCFYCGSPL